MVRRIGGLIRAGEIDNTVRNSIHGWLHFWGQHHPILLHLTGNCGRGLRGRKLRFRSADHRERATRPPRLLQPQQIGPAARMRLAPCERPYDRSWRMRLMLEWFSQDGRILVDLWEPAIEFILRPHVPHSSFGADEMANLSSADGDDLGVCESLRGLFSSNGQSREPSRAATNASPSASDDSYWRMLDDVVTGARDVPLNSLFDPPLKLLPAEQLGERELKSALRRVLARLARHGIAVDVCPHFTERDTYCWLLKDILHGEQVFPDLPRLGYVMHYMTGEKCARCAACHPN